MAKIAKVKKASEGIKQVVDGVNAHVVKLTGKEKYFVHMENAVRVGEEVKLIGKQVKDLLKKGELAMREMIVEKDKFWAGFNADIEDDVNAKNHRFIDAENGQAPAVAFLERDPHTEKDHEDRDNVINELFGGDTHDHSHAGHQHAVMEVDAKTGKLLKSNISELPEEVQNLIKKLFSKD